MDYLFVFKYDEFQSINIINFYILLLPLPLIKGVLSLFEKFFVFILYYY